MKNKIVKKDWKYYVKKAKKSQPYNMQEDPEQKKKRRKKAQKFYKKYGFRYEECWNLDHTLATYILPRLAYMKDNYTSYPGDLAEYNEFEELIKEGYDVWQEYLSKMILAFDHIIDEDLDNDPSIVDNKEEWEKWQKEKNEGLKLFGEWFEDLWD